MKVFEIYENDFGEDNPIKWIIAFNKSHVEKYLGNNKIKIFKIAEIDLPLDSNGIDFTVNKKGEKL